MLLNPRPFTPSRPKLLKPRPFFSPKVQRSVELLTKNEEKRRRLRWSQLQHHPLAPRLHAAHTLMVRGRLGSSWLDQYPG